MRMIQPGSAIVEVLPLVDALLVTAKIRAVDIAFLHLGRETIVKFTNYDCTIHGGLKAKLGHIGAACYLFKLCTERNQLVIILDMVAWVDIVSGKNTLSYLLKTIIKAFCCTLHECQAAFKRSK